MTTHRCIHSLYNICVSLYNFRATLEFPAGLQIPLNFHGSHMSIRVKVDYIALVPIVAYPVAARLVSCIEIDDTTLYVVR